MRVSTHLPTWSCLHQFFPLRMCSTLFSFNNYWSQLFFFSLFYFLAVNRTFGLAEQLFHHNFRGFTATASSAKLLHAARPCLNARLKDKFETQHLGNKTIQPRRHWSAWCCVWVRLHQPDAPCVQKRPSSVAAVNVWQEKENKRKWKISRVTS